MRISDWSSDVCSSDLRRLLGFGLLFLHRILLGGRLLRRRLLGRLVIVVVIVVVVAVGAVDMVVVGLDRGFQFLAGHFAFADFGLVEQEVDDLVLIERGAKLRGGQSVLLAIFDETLAILGARLLRGLRSDENTYKIPST